MTSGSSVTSVKVNNTPYLVVVNSLTGLVVVVSLSKRIVGTVMSLSSRNFLLPFIDLTYVYERGSLRKGLNNRL